MGFPAKTTDGETVEIVEKAAGGLLIDKLGNKYKPSIKHIRLELVEAADAIEAAVEQIGDVVEASVELAEEVIEDAKDALGGDQAEQGEAPTEEPQADGTEAEAPEAA